MRTLGRVDLLGRRVSSNKKSEPFSAAPCTPQFRSKTRGLGQLA